MRALRLGVVVGVVLTLGVAAPAVAQPRAGADRYDATFRKYSKRFFGPAFDWRLFKAQGLAESNLNPDAQSGVGARGVMQLMPATFREVASRNPELTSVDDAEMNIAAGIAYDRTLWTRWRGEAADADHERFMLASYNAGRGTLLTAQQQARARALDPRAWPSIEQVAPQVPRWRHDETLGYVRRIFDFLAALDDRGRVPRSGRSARGRRQS